MVKECLDVLQVLHSLDAPDSEVIPLVGVPVTQVPGDATEQVRGEADVVQTISSVQCVDSRVMPHDLLKALAKQWTRENLGGKASGHALDECSPCASL